MFWTDLRRVVIAGVVALATGSGALAADVPGAAPLYKAAPAPPPPTDWTGLYAGAHFGYKWGGGYHDEFDDYAYYRGVIGGAYAGFNWQVSRLVLGIEADLGWASTRVDDTDFGPGFSARLDWLGSFRGRAGVAFDRHMVYGTGGIAWAHQSYLTVGAPSDHHTHVGWIAGAGVETMLTRNWTARLEYLRFDPGSVTYTVLGPYEADIRPGNIVRLGLGYKFDWGGPVVARY
jgi:outer membrane immunogenic protein